MPGSQPGIKGGQGCLTTAVIGRKRQALSTGPCVLASHILLTSEGPPHSRDAPPYDRRRQLSAAIAVFVAKIDEIIDWPDIGVA
jgi:hypothetical protein